MKINKDLVIKKGDSKDYSHLTEVSGYVDVQEGATFTAPALTEVSGSVYVQEGATFTAPALTEVSGYVGTKTKTGKIKHSIRFINAGQLTVLPDGYRFLKKTSTMIFLQKRQEKNVRLILHACSLKQMKGLNF